MMATAAAASPWSVPLRYSELNNATVYTQTQPDTAEAELVLGTIRTCAEGTSLEEFTSELNGSKSSLESTRA